MPLKKSTKETSKVNAKIGKEWERNICLVLSNYGFWVHNMLNGILGQPCDIVAINGHLPLLLDCKHLKKGLRFSFKDIEDNQMTTFERASKYNNIKECGFIIICEEYEKIYYLPYTLVKTAEENGIVSIDCTQLETFVDRANKWRKMYEDYNRKEPSYTRL